MPITDASLHLFMLPLPALLAVVAAVCILGGLAVWALLVHVGRFGPAWTPQGAFVPAIIGLFALVLSFTANDAWRRGEAAYAALLAEHQELTAVFNALDSPPPGAAAPVIRQALVDYLRQSLATEWSVQNSQPDPAATASLDSARLATARAAVGGTAAESSNWRATAAHLEALTRARGVRLTTGGLFGDLVRWAVLVALYLMAASAVVAGHLDRPRGALMALAIFMAGAIAALSLVAVSEHPYSGWDAVEPNRLRTLLAAVSAP